MCSVTGSHEPDELHCMNAAGVISLCKHEPVDDKLCIPAIVLVDDFC